MYLYGIKKLNGVAFENGADIAVEEGVCVCVFIISVLRPTTNHSPGLDETYFRFSVHSWCIQLSLFVSCHCGHVIKSV